MYYGFDVGGTKIAFAVYDQHLQCLFAEQHPTPDNFPDFMRLIKHLVNNADLQFSCRGTVGIGIPGACNQQTQKVYCANVPAINGRALVADLSVNLERDVKLENDANCFLLSECYGGNADDSRCALAITLGTGVGGAIFINGALHHGRNSFAGEIGHYPIPATLLLKYPDLPTFSCGCGRQMCFETYVSGTGLSNLYRHYADTAVDCPQILQKYRVADKTATMVMDIYFDILAAGVATAILVLDPDAIVFGGGLANFSELIYELEKRLPAHLLNSVSLPKINFAKFGASAGVRGAALLNYHLQ